MAATACLSKRLDALEVLCQACAHACKLKEGAYGICGVRKVEKGELRLLVYGLASAVNVDRVEKKPMYHFLPNSKAFSVGTVGCNFTCSFCQNADISQFPQEHQYQITGQALSPERIVTLAQEHGCASIAYTYNEPVVWFEYSYDTAKLAHKAGLKNIYVTSGYETKKALDLLAPFIDGMNIDLKSFNNDFYKEICGAKLKPVLETIKHAYKRGIWIEITTLLIPGKNDSDEEIQAIATFIASVDTHIPWHLSAFRPTYKMTDVTNTPLSTLERAYKIAQEVGLKYIYLGNVNAASYQSTYCPSCKREVVSRHGNIGQSVNNQLTKEGLCPFCEHALEGVWEQSSTTAL